MSETSQPAEALGDGSSSEFARLWSLGYKRIVPVIPPDAEVSKKSNLFRRVGTKQDARGKLPGVKGADGLWHSWDWIKHVTDPEDFQRWQDMGAGAGLFTGDGLIAIDADTIDEALAKIIRDKVREHFGETPIRVGRYPKALYLIRVTDPYAYRRIDFGDERVELLSDRKFFVAHGIHNKTLKPYTWPKALVPYDDLPLFEPEQIDAFMEDLRAHLPEASKVVIEGGGEAPANQAVLRGDPVTVRAALRATPNTSDHFPTRNDYLKVGYAVKAAVEDEKEAYEIWAEWCDRWDKGQNDPGVTEADWRRMKPPFQVGANWLYETAERTSDGVWTTAEAHFKAIEGSDDDRVDGPAREKEKNKLFKLVRAGDMEARPPDYLIRDLLETSTLASLFGDPGGGKSFMALHMACCVATGTPFFGAAVKQGPVIYLAGEGHGGLSRRWRAWECETGQNLQDTPLLFSTAAARFLDKDHAKAVAAAVDEIARTDGTPRLIVVDTLARSFAGGDENSTKDMSEFVAALDNLKARYAGCTVLVVHHSGIGDKNRGRGSGALKGGLDAEYRVEKKDAAIVLTPIKTKDAPIGDPTHYQLKDVVLGVDDEGKNYGSAVLVATARPQKAKGKKMTENAELALATFHEARRQTGQVDDVSALGLHVDDWREVFYKRHTGDTLHSKKLAFQRARKEMQSAGLVSVSADVYRLTTSADAMFTAIPDEIHAPEKGAEIFSLDESRAAKQGAGVFQ